MPNRTSRKAAKVTAAQERYRQQLSLRITLGCKLVDALSHGSHDGLMRLYEECNALDESLERSRRYRRDYPEQVVAAEELRYHTPGETCPADHEYRPCSWCRRDTSGAPAGIALPTRIAA